MNIDDVQIEKLPKWAQRLVSRLEMDVEFWRSQFNRAQDGTTAPIAWYTRFDDPVGLPDRATVVMRIGNGSIDLNLRDGRVKVHGSHTVIVKPEASNAFSIELQP